MKTSDTHLIRYTQYHPAVDSKPPALRTGSTVYILFSTLYINP